MFSSPKFASETIQFSLTQTSAFEINFRIDLLNWITLVQFFEISFETFLQNSTRRQAQLKDKRFPILFRIFIIFTQPLRSGTETAALSVLGRTRISLSFENLSFLIATRSARSVVFGANTVRRVTALPSGVSVAYVSINILERKKKFANTVHRLYPVDKSRVDTDTITEEAVDFGNRSKKTD